VNVLAASAVRLFVVDLAPAVDFYRDRLGMPLLASGDDYAVFDAGTIRLVVERGHVDERGQPLVGRFTGLSLRSADVHRDHARLQALGVRLLGEPEVQPWGGTLVTFEDPSGNALQLVQYPE
jgi:catechol 2,3-dioxygenase-like lactoylglutathione lyase family enzyme